MYYDKHDYEFGELSCLKWYIARSTKEGETKCGDTYVIKEFEGRVLVSVIDGLGHGPKAAEAGHLAEELLKNSSTEPLLTLIQSCHKVLRNTRGVVMALALIDIEDNTLGWGGVGNIDGSLLYRDQNHKHCVKRMISQRGIVGYKMPVLQMSTESITKGNTLVFATDGVHRNYLEGVGRSQSPRKIVEQVSRNSFKQSDDGLILAAKYF